MRLAWANDGSLKNKYEYPQAAHTPYARLWTRAATYTIMSKAHIRAILANHLSFSELQNALFCILK